jgi:hypothetical protein
MDIFKKVKNQQNVKKIFRFSFKIKSLKWEQRLQFGITSNQYNKYTFEYFWYFIYMQFTYVLKSFFDSILFLQIDFYFSNVSLFFLFEELFLYNFYLMLWLKMRRGWIYFSNKLSSFTVTKNEVIQPMKSLFTHLSLLFNLFIKLLAKFSNISLIN